MGLASGSINGEAGYAGFYIRIDWWENSNDVQTNTSNVGVNIVLCVPNQYQTTSTMNGSYTINGTSHTFSRTSQQYGRGPKDYILASWSGNIVHDADGKKSIGLSATVTSGWASLGTMPTATGTAVLTELATPPTGLDVSLIGSAGQNYANLSGSITGYGSPLGSGRYMELAILGSSTYGAPYRYVRSATGATSMSSTRIDNTSSTGSPSLTISPNTRYYIGVAATNGSASANKVSISFITKPASFTTLNCTNEGDLVTVTWARGAEGNAATVTKQYSIDGGTTWTTFTTNPFTFRASHSGTITVRATNSEGSSPTKSTTFVAQVSHLYGSVDNQSKLLDPVYAGVDGVAKKLTKLYIGDQNGVARKVIG